ncbi:MAG: NUDIX hydrolase [Asgard group archaeon]|nr:NUDIX hydrolase [Asgard group archaeon]
MTFTEKQIVVVTAIIENHKGEILLLQRKPDVIRPNIWEDAGGRLKKNESMINGLKREILEETGLQNYKIIKAIATFPPNGANGSKEKLGITYWCKMLSQKEQIKLSTEHQRYQWASLQEARKMAGHKALKKHIGLLIAEKKSNNMEGK